jgi:hypothetical protein
MDVRSAIRLEGLRLEITEDGNLLGRVIHIDRFGNLVTNIDAAAWRGAGRVLGVEINGRRITGRGGTYADAAVGQPLALIGSRGYLEIAVNSGSAHSLTGARTGDRVRVLCGDNTEGVAKNGLLRHQAMDGRPEPASIK